MKTESFTMRVFRKLGMDSVAWSLRRLYCPVKRTDLVLEVGSGGNPYFRANVLCDAYFETHERHFVPLIYDRPTVLATAEKLPFKDDTFDFIIASHVLEHSSEPYKFLQEIQRVGKAGYIEVPDAFMERVCSYPMHRLEITERYGQLTILKKYGVTQDNELRELFTHKASPVFPKWVSRYPFHFHTRYYWSRDDGGIRYKIINPEYLFDWEVLEPEKKVLPDKNISALLKHFSLLTIRKFFSQNRRNHRIDLFKLLMCIDCGTGTLERNGSSVSCKNCSRKYPVFKNMIIDFMNVL